jgi:hypothetical protein
MRNKGLKPTHCQSCGMLVNDPAEFHTFAYCAAFKVMLNGDDVRDNMEYTVRNHPKFAALLAAARDVVEGLDESYTWLQVHDAIRELKRAVEEAEKN